MDWQTHTLGSPQNLYQILLSHLTFFLLGTTSKGIRSSHGSISESMQPWQTYASSPVVLIKTRISQTLTKIDFGKYLTNSDLNFDALVTNINCKLRVGQTRLIYNYSKNEIYNLLQMSFNQFRNYVI